MHKRTGLLAAILVATGSISRAADWPQFRGPARDGISRETNLLKSWPADGPRLLWTAAELGVGFSGPAIVGERLFVSVGRGDTEYVIALDLTSGGDKPPKELWSAKIGPLFDWKGNTWNAGPNVTPTVDGELIFALGGRGDLACVEAATGKEVWRKNLPRELGGEVNPIGGGSEDPTPLGWGYAWAPLVDGHRLICVPGGKQGLLAALDKKTGKLLWQSKEITDQASYSSPLAVDVGGIRMYIQVTNGGIAGVAANDGKLLWSYRREPAYDDVVIATPVFHDNHVFATVGFQQGCDLIKLVPGASGITVEKLFSNKKIENRDGGLVLVDGHLYGHSENIGWFCMEFKTGKVVWSERNKFGRGSVTYADGRLYCCPEKGGSIILLEATPRGWTEAGRLRLPRDSTLRKPSGLLWTQPVIANGRLYIRDQELLFCFEIKQ